jgi:hypothetical protein
VVDLTVVDLTVVRLTVVRLTVVNLRVVNLRVVHLTQALELLWCFCWAFEAKLEMILVLQTFHLMKIS